MAEPTEPTGPGEGRRPVPRGPRGPVGRKLVLHVDLNNTILISDAVTSQGTVAALEAFLSTVTWGRMSPAGDQNCPPPFPRGPDPPPPTQGAPWPSVMS